MNKDLEKAFEYKEYLNVDWKDTKFYLYNRFNEQFIEYFKDKIDWNDFFFYYSNKEFFINNDSFIEKYKDKINFEKMEQAINSL